VTTGDTGLPPLRYLDTATVERHLPDIERALQLAGIVVDRIDRPEGATAKASVRPLGSGVFAQAIPGRLDTPDAPDGRARLGVKWIAGSAVNRQQGLPAMAALIVLNDPDTGIPVALLDGGPVTALRTAALTGVAIRALVGAQRRPGTAVILGAGVQGRAHMPVLRACGVARVVVVDRHPDRAADVVAIARGLGLSADATDDAAKAVRAADIVVSATALHTAGAWMGPDDVGRDAIVIPVDYGAQVTAALVAAATTFLVDDRVAFHEHQQRGRLDDWPEPTGTIGAALRGGGAAMDVLRSGIAVALHQGPGLADVLFADAVLGSALAAGDGQELRR
jgi:ornithine cyclodeaminase/alanine dehydrogenase